jgi:hypothetical protein
MSKHRKVQSASEARRCLSAVKASGLSVKEWARPRGIDGRSLHAWQMNLERAAKPAVNRKCRSPSTAPVAANMHLVELVPSASPGSRRYVVHVGAASVELDDDFDAQTLRKIVEVLRSC